MLWIVGVIRIGFVQPEYQKIAIADMNAGYSLTPSTVAMATKYWLLCNLITDICLMKQGENSKD